MKGGFADKGVYKVSGGLSLNLDELPQSHLVKNLPAIQETLVLFLDWEDPLEKG